MPGLLSPFYLYKGEIRLSCLQVLSLTSILIYLPLLLSVPFTSPLLISQASTRAHKQNWPYHYADHLKGGHKSGFGVRRTDHSARHTYQLLVVARTILVYGALTIVHVTPISC